MVLRGANAERPVRRYRQGAAPCTVSDMPSHPPRRSSRPPARPNPAKPGPPVDRRVNRSPARTGAAAGGAASPATDWGDVAAWYDALVGESGSEYHREVVIPGALRLLDAQPGVDRVIDVACGQGVLCRVLHQRGIEVAGIDAADDLIAAARARGTPVVADPDAAAGPPGTAITPRAAGSPDGAGALGASGDASSVGDVGRAGDAVRPHIVYRTGDARDLKGFGDAQFTAAACILAIQNIHPPQQVFAAVARVLRPGGRFVFVMTHPCFRGPKATSWGWDETERVQYRRVDRYLVPRKEPIVAHPGRKTGQYTWTFHRPVSDYIKFARNAGLMIDAMEEWTSHKTSTSGPRAPAENLARKEIPLFMAMRAVKVSGS